MAKSPIEKDRLWPKPVDTLADWDKAAGQAGMPEAEQQGMAELLDRKGRFNASSDNRVETGEGAQGRKRHISDKKAQTGAAMSDLEGQGYAAGQAARLLDPKRGSRARSRMTHDM